MRGIGYGRNQTRIHHCGSKTEKQAADQPKFEFASKSRQEQGRGLNPHSGDNQARAPPAVAQRPGRDLENAPGRGINGLENPNALDPQSEPGEEQRKDAPTHAVIEIVYEPGLGRCEQIAVAEGGEGKDLPEIDRGSLAPTIADLRAHVIPGVADEGNGKRRTEQSVSDPR
jgi:hypothetical protein